MAVTELTTYKDLLVYLHSLPVHDLEQEIMILPHNPTEEPTRLEPVNAIGTVKEFGEETRSAIDFKHHPEQIVISRDLSPFSKDGDSYWTMQEDGSLVGNKTGKVIKPFKGEEDD